MLTTWSARTLATLPPRHATVIRPFVEWHIIRDARRRSARGRYTTAAHKSDCSNIRAAIDFLTWLDSRRLTLRTLQQRQLDTWATDRPSVRARSIPFIRWASARRLAPADLIIEHPPAQLPGQFHLEKVHRDQLHRCLNDASLPLDVRIAGALVRLYGLPLTRIVEVTASQLHHDADHTYLTVNHHPVLLPPKLARLINDQIHTNTSRHAGPDSARYLLPGQIPGRPRNPSASRTP